MGVQFKGSLRIWLTLENPGHMMPLPLVNRTRRKHLTGILLDCSIVGTLCCCDKSNDITADYAQTTRDTQIISRWRCYRYTPCWGGIHGAPWRCR
jgi:hypothetical protein